MDGVSRLSLTNSGIFPEYILPHLRICIHDEQVQVRATYARNIAKLGKLASEFAEIAMVIYFLLNTRATTKAIVNSAR